MMRQYDRAVVVDPNSARYKQSGDVEDVVSDEHGTVVHVQFADGVCEMYDHVHVEPERLLCGCGSLKFWVALYDARGIYVARVCDACEEEVKSHYRPEIFSNSAYEADEPIEED